MSIRLLLAVALVPFAFAGSTSRTVPDFQLTAVSGPTTRPFTRKDLLGKVWVANFMFTRCNGPCPLNSAKMARLQRTLPPGIQFASFTVDPKFDQADRLRAYGDRFHAEAGRWFFLTAPDEETLIPLFKGTFHTAFRQDPRSPCGYETFHSVKFFLIGPNGRIEGEYSANDDEQMKRLPIDALALLHRRKT